MKAPRRSFAADRRGRRRGADRTLPDGADGQRGGRRGPRRRLHEEPPAAGGVADLAAMASVQALDPAATQLAPGGRGRDRRAQPLERRQSRRRRRWAATPPIPRSRPPSASSRAGPARIAVQVTLQGPVHLYFAGLITGRSSPDAFTHGPSRRGPSTPPFSIGSGLASLNGGVAQQPALRPDGQSGPALRGQLPRRWPRPRSTCCSTCPHWRPAQAFRRRASNQVLATSVAPSAALGALADTLNAEGEGAAASAAQTLASASAALPTTPLSALFDLGPYGAQDHASEGSGASLSVGALGLADAVLGAAGGGSRQLSLSLNGAVPGVAQLSAVLAIGQRPNNSPWPHSHRRRGRWWCAHAQMRLYLQAGLAPGLLAPGDGRRACDPADLCRGGVGPGQAAGHRVPVERRRPGLRPLPPRRALGPTPSPRSTRRRWPTSPPPSRCRPRPWSTPGSCASPPTTAWTSAAARRAGRRCASPRPTSPPTP